VLQEQLSGVKVYKVADEAEKQAYIIGKISEEKWAGLKTTVVETGASGAFSPRAGAVQSPKEARQQC